MDLLWWTFMGHAKTPLTLVHSSRPQAYSFQTSDNLLNYSPQSMSNGEPRGSPLVGVVHACVSKKGL